MTTALPGELQRPETLADLPWWTEADDAELSALTWELVDGIYEHRELCALCAVQRETGVPCRHVGAAIEIVRDWIYGRELKSRAKWFRYRRDMLEIELERHKVGSA